MPASLSPAISTEKHLIQSILQRKKKGGKKGKLAPFLYPQSRITARVRGISTPANCSNGP